MVDDATLKAWFAREVFPLEGALTRYIRRNWRNESDVADLRQDIYAKVYGGAREGGLPRQAKPFLFTVARNHLISQMRRAQVVSIELVSDFESSPVLGEAGVFDRELTAREELRRAQAGLDRLPPRCREVVVLRKVEGLSIREVSERLSVSTGTVEQQLSYGMRALVDFMLGGSGRIRRGPAKDQGAEEVES